jgi:hypothetical protein
MNCKTTVGQRRRQSPLRVKSVALSKRRRFSTSAIAPLATKPARHRNMSRRANLGLMRRSKTIYSITSSARPNRAIGKARPSDLAVLRLMTNSVFVDCWTGRSAGFSPWRIRPT